MIPLGGLLKIWSGPSRNLGDKLTLNENRSVGEPAEGSLTEIPYHLKFPAVGTLVIKPLHPLLVIPIVALASRGDFSPHWPYS